MRRKLLVAISLLLTACATSPSLTPAPISPPITSAPTANSTTAPSTSTPLAPTAEPEATISAPVATATPYPPLQTDGPYFIYLKQQDDKQLIIIMDENAEGRKIVTWPLSDQLPINPLTYGGHNSAIAPNGKWLAFYTGTAGELIYGALIPGPYDLALNLLEISTGKVFRLTGLLSEDYPHNFERLDEIYAKNESYSREGNYTAFFGGLRSLAWSPDSRYLAFAGEMDGPSSDVYIYDTETGQTRRLTNGNEHVQSILWSPDAKWIIHNSAFGVGVEVYTTFHAVNIDGTVVKTLSINNDGFKGWLSSSMWLESDGSMGRGAHDLRSVDIVTGQVVSLWPSAWHAYAIDSETATILLRAIPQVEYDLSGLYIIDGKTGVSAKIDGSPFWEVRYWGLNGIPFIAHNQLEGDERTFAVYANGSATPIDAK